MDLSPWVGCHTLFSLDSVGMTEPVRLGYDADQVPVIP